MARLSRIFGFGSRTGRAGYWLSLAAIAALLAVLLVAFWVYALSIPGAYENGGPTPFPKDPLGIAGAIVWFALLGLTLLAAFAVSVRRLHDRNMAWWWIFIFQIGPNLLYGLGENLWATDNDRPPLAYALFVASMAGFIWGLVELGFLRGTRGGNRFGPDPLAGRA